ncbi:MAG: cytochrome-c peroxidase [Pseudomonadales bacterium]
MSKIIRIVALSCSLGAAAVAVPAGAADALMTTAQQLFKPIPEQPPAVAGIDSTPARVTLGRMLYFEPRLSESHAISCNSCHMVGLGGVDLQETSIGHHWQRGGRNAPTVLNATFNTAQFWDGRAEDLRQQAGGPLVNPIEMGTSESHVVEQLKGIPGYVRAFAEAFPQQPEPVTFDNVRNSIALFEATLITPDAPFDRYLKGDADALSAAQQEGLNLFISKGCAACHKGTNLGGDMYAPFGVMERPGADILPLGDKGRYEVTKTVSDEYVFKVPTLRNLELTPPYFHSGKVWDMRQAVAVMGASQLGIQLSEQEVDRIADFLLSLTGRQPEVIYPILPPSVASTPRPQP